MGGDLCMAWARFGLGCKHAAETRSDWLRAVVPGTSSNTYIFERFDVLGDACQRHERCWSSAR